MSRIKELRSRIVFLKPFLLWTGLALGVFFIVTLFFSGAVLGYVRMYEGRIYPGVRVLNISIGGLTPAEARQTLSRSVDEALDRGLLFELEGERAVIYPSGGQDLPDAIRYHLNDAVDRAYLVGRSQPLAIVLLELLSARIRTIHVPVETEIDFPRIESGLTAQYAHLLHPSTDASYRIDLDSGSARVIVIPEVDGAQLDTSRFQKLLKRQAEILSFSPIYLQMIPLPASVRAESLQPLVSRVEGILQRPGLVLTYEDERFPISTSTLISWISADPSTREVTIDPIAFASSVRALAGNLEHESKNGTLEVADGKVVSFTAGTRGQRINIEKTLDPILTSWPPSSTFPIIVEETQGEILGLELESFGIRELIGTGRSNFRGSPRNRVFNITKAVYDHVNGTILEPGETFSMLETLGPVNGDNGWKPELVIKGNKTVPEYGGGLCQIGTTMFRGAVDTGLPIVERRNHSYRVSYYEPAGTDATIYEPAPDFKFLNDTGHHIYINAYIEGTEVVFEFWGTKDGRAVETTKPVIYNIKPPPPVKLIETLDLEPGKKDCTESAHAGADAYFSTAVTYADGRMREETFQSHYRPWGAVCLIGVEKLSENPERFEE